MAEVTIRGMRETHGREYCVLPRPQWTGVHLSGQAQLGGVPSASASRRPGSFQVGPFTCACNPVFVHLQEAQPLVIPRRSCQPRLLPSSHFRCRLQALRISSTRDTSILKIEGTRMLPRAGMPGRDEIPTRFSPVERCHACDLVNLRGARGFRVDSKTPQS